MRIIISQFSYKILKVEKVLETGNFTIFVLDYSLGYMRFWLPEIKTVSQLRLPNTKVPKNGIHVCSKLMIRKAFNRPGSRMKRPTQPPSNSWLLPWIYGANTFEKENRLSQVPELKYLKTEIFDYWSLTLLISKTSVYYGHLEKPFIPTEKSFSFYFFIY